MSEEPDIITPLIKEVGEERSFRTKIAGQFVELIKRPEIPFSLKALIVIAVFLFVVIGAVVSICLIHMVSCAISKTPFDGFSYLMALVGLSIALIALAVPVILKAGNAEQAMRLNQSFDRIYSARTEAA